MRVFDFDLELITSPTFDKHPMNQFHELESRLQFAFIDAALYIYKTYNKRLLITCILRSPKHANDLHAPNLKRALDFNVDEYGKLPSEPDPDEAEDLANYINSRWIYDSERPDYSILVYGHRDEKNLHWNHGHMQIHPRTIFIDNAERDPFA